VALAARGIRIVNEMMPLLHMEKLIREMARVSARGRLDIESDEG
jgi:hypothetical protein